jgi:hypothetical protein
VTGRIVKSWKGRSCRRRGTCARLVARRGSPFLRSRMQCDDAQAVAEVNSFEYGLAGAVFGKDAERTERIAAQLQAGTVWINCACVCLDTDARSCHRHYPASAVLRAAPPPPSAPACAVTGVRLVVPDHTQGLPVLRALSLCTCCCH